jgi:hypothetical protein
MPKAGFIPSSDAAFFEWSKNLAAVSVSHKTEREIKDEKLAALQTLFDAFQAVFDKMADVNHGKADTLIKNETRSASLSRRIRPTTRPLRTRIRRRPASRSTPAPVPSSYPEADADTSVPRRISIRFRDRAGTRRGKPDGVHGAEIRWTASEAPAANPEEPANPASATRSPHTFEFSGEERGKMVYFCLRRENAKAEKGPRGEVFSAVIP